MLSLPLAFFAGLLSFLSPCVLPLVPSYLAYIGGSGAAGKTAQRSITLRNSLFFILGFSLIFITLGASASALGSVLLVNRDWLSRLGGVLVIVFGLVMLGIFKIPVLLRDTRKRFKGDSTTVWGAGFLGMAFAAGWTPCIGPVLGGILTLASQTGTLGQGVLLLGIYAFGLALPFFLAALALEGFLKFSARFRRFLPWVERVAGSLLVVAGLLMLTGTYTKLNQFLLQLTPEWLVSRL